MSFLADRNAVRSAIGYHSNSWASCRYISESVYGACFIQFTLRAEQL